MEWKNRIIHLGLTFGFIWNYLRGGKSTLSRWISIILWGILVFAMVYVLLLWLSVPTYNHYIYLDRLFLERPPINYQKENGKTDYFVFAKYKLSLSSGVSAFKNTETTRFKENVIFVHEKFPAFENTKDRNSWSSLYLNNNPQNFNEVFSDELSKIAQKECQKYNISFKDLKYGYYFLHCYQEDIARYGGTENKIVANNSETDTIFDFKGIEITHRTNGINEKHFVQDKDVPMIPKGKYDGEVQYVELNNIGFGNYNLHLRTTNQHVLTNFMYSLFKMYDLTKARYVLYFDSNAIDSVSYTIEFEEGVSFSDINVTPAYKDMNTLQFVGSDRKSQQELANGVKFYVEYLESSNIQYIRECVMVGLLIIPLTKFLKNFCMLFTKQTKNTSNTNETEQILYLTANNVSRKKEKTINKTKKKKKKRK